ncbi:hypothetical protein C4573_04995 [Candidatus Woesearchaeota archaeon]|nr:MAG: hypothetical protein C4573_04995 [Candidatus Woesearchaeota archaeon]
MILLKCNMNHVIILRGPLGVGKSTIAKKLASVLKAKHIDVDKLLEKYQLDKPQKGEPCIPLKNFIVVQKKILPILEKRLKKTIIIDGCFYHKKQIEHLKKNISKINVFTLKAPLKTCIARDSRRRKSYGKDAAKAVHTLVSAFDYGFVIETDKRTVQQTVKEILKELS